MIRVRLSYDEIIQGVIGGCLRHLENMKDNKCNFTHGYDERNAWQVHIEGALGELAVAKVLKLYWSKGKRGGDDVGPYRVRTSARDDADLILHETDPDDTRHYSVTGSNGIYRIHGWILARDGKREEWWRDPTGSRPAFFVPRSALVPVDAQGSLPLPLRLVDGA